MSCEDGNFVLEIDLVRASGDGMTDRRPEPESSLGLASVEQVNAGLQVPDSIPPLDAGGLIFEPLVSKLGENIMDQTVQVLEHLK